MFYDIETTGVNVRRHSIHQIAGYIEIDGAIVEEFNIKSQPHPKCEYDPIALKTCKVTEEQLKGYQPMKEAHRELINILDKYVDRYDKTQKMFQVGFNNRAFGDVFLRAWFEQCGDRFYTSWFWSDSLDVMVLASEYLINRRSQMPSFKLKRVAKELGIKVDETKLHDAFYDVFLTREIYMIATGLEIEV